MAAKGHFWCLDRKRLSRAGTRGHALDVPSPFDERPDFGFVERFRTAVTPSLQPKWSGGARPGEERSARPLHGRTSGLDRGRPLIEQWDRG